jgi:hypothetical protein
MNTNDNLVGKGFNVKDISALHWIWLNGSNWLDGRTSLVKIELRAEVR